MTDQAPTICLHLECNRLALPGKPNCKPCSAENRPNRPEFNVTWNEDLTDIVRCPCCDNEAEDYL